MSQTNEWLLGVLRIDQHVRHTAWLPLYVSRRGDCVYYATIDATTDTFLRAHGMYRCTQCSFVEPMTRCLDCRHRVGFCPQQVCKVPLVLKKNNFAYSGQDSSTLANNVSHEAHLQQQLYCYMPDHIAPVIGNYLDFVYLIKRNRANSAPAECKIAVQLHEQSMLRSSGSIFCAGNALTHSSSQSHCSQSDVAVCTAGEPNIVDAFATESLCKEFKVTSETSTEQCQNIFDTLCDKLYHYMFLIGLANSCNPKVCYATNFVEPDYTRAQNSMLCGQLFNLALQKELGGCSLVHTVVPKSDVNCDFSCNDDTTNESDFDDSLQDFDVEEDESDCFDLLMGNDQSDLEQSLQWREGSFTHFFYDFGQNCTGKNFVAAKTLKKTK